MNDFLEKHGILEYHSYGQGHLQIFNCSVTSGEHRGFTLSDDHIFIFLNFNQIAKFKTKSEAKNLLLKLINNCPKECQADFESHTSEILKVLD